jgi:hypothetical protein
MHPSCPFVVNDLNHDGRLDISFSRGHAYGMYWWEYQEPDLDGTTNWKQHVIDESWSQTLRLKLAEIDGDGEDDLVARKCIRAHNSRDVGEADPPVVYYYTCILGIARPKSSRGTRSPARTSTSRSDRNFR